MSLAVGPALAQEEPTAKPVRTLISVGYGDDFGIFVEAPLPRAGPHVEGWAWMIRKEAKMLNGAPYDMTVSRERFDCNARTRSQLYTDGFHGDTFLGRDKTGTPPSPIQPGVEEAIAGIMCGAVDVSKDAPIPDIAAARAHVAARLSAQ